MIAPYYNIWRHVASAASQPLRQNFKRQQVLEKKKHKKTRYWPCKWWRHYMALCSKQTVARAVAADKCTGARNKVKICMIKKKYILLFSLALTSQYRLINTFFFLPFQRHRTMIKACNKDLRLFLFAIRRHDGFVGLLVFSDRAGDCVALIW